MAAAIAATAAAASCGRIGYDDALGTVGASAGEEGRDGGVAGSGGGEPSGGTGPAPEGGTSGLGAAGTATAGASGAAGAARGGGAGGLTAGTTAGSSGAAAAAGAGAGGAAGVATGGSDPFSGLWAGMARFGSDAYEIDVGVTAGANVAELVSTFYVPAPYHCGGVGRLQSLGTTLVYKETLLFGTVASCIGAGTATLSPVSAASLDYTWTLSGKQDHHGTLIRRDSGGAPVVPAAAVGLWHGTLGTRELYIVVAPAGIGGTLAHELWVGDKCGATLTLTKVDGADLFATEQITSTGTSCPTGGSMTLTPLTAATLNATWRAPGRAFSATLARAR